MDIQQMSRNNKPLSNLSHISLEMEKNISLIDAFSESNMDSGYHSSNVTSINNENLSLEFDKSTKAHQSSLSKNEIGNKKILNINNSQDSARKSEHSSCNYTTKSQEKVFKENFRSRFCEIKYSPINHYKLKPVFTKTRSESINSSTPLRDFEKSSYFESVDKSKSLSKFEKSKFKNHNSFSPGKHTYFKKLTIEKSLLANVYNYNDEIKDSLPNPAKRLLLFDENKFEKLLNYTGTEKKVLYSVPELKKPTKKSHKIKILKRQDAVSDRNIPENFISFDDKNNILSEPYITSYFQKMKTLDAQCSEIRPLVAANQLRTADSLEFLKVDAFQRETKKQIDKIKLIETDIYDSAKKNCLEELRVKDLAVKTNRTDSKILSIPDKVDARTITELKSTNQKIKRSLSVDFDPEREKSKILYPYLPCTPPKKKPKRTLKRFTSNKTHFKRSLYEIKHKVTLRASYEGIEKLNIMLHLQNTLPAVDIILNCMSGSDLLNMSLVSRKWKCLVENNSKNNLKRLKYISSTNLVKENFMAGNFLNCLKHQKSIPLRDFNCRSTNSIDRKRSLDEGLVCSPPVSPSKRKFHENQKVCLMGFFIYIFFYS